LMRRTFMISGKWGGAWLFAVAFTAFGAHAQTYSRTEQIVYHDNLNRWVLGQTARATCVASVPAATNCDGDDHITQATFDATTGNLTSSYSFGRLNQIVTYNSDGTVATVKDGNNNVASLSSWKRGVPRTVVYPATPESPAGATETALVDDNGWISSTTDENGFTTSYTYDPMGRVASVTYPTGDSTAWNVENFYFTPIPHDEHGLAAGHWTLRQRVGDRHVNTYYDALWRPVLEESLDYADIGGTLTQVVKRYDANGRLIFQSYPKRGVDRPNESQGIHTTYDALDRVTGTSQNSELGLLTTLTEYLSGFMVRATNPRGFQTITQYQTFDQPTYDFPNGITQFAGVDTSATEIHRDIFGKPTRIRKRNADGSLFVDRHYVYHANQLLCKVIEPETGATVLGYDDAGNLTHTASGLAGYVDTNYCNHAEAWASGRAVVRTFDARNRMQSLSFPDGRGNQLFTYWPDGLTKRIETHNNGVGLDVVYNQYAYNRRRLLESEYVQHQGGDQWLVNYGYDANGSLASQSYPTGLIISYLPNALGQAREARDQAGYAYASGATYYPNGALSQFSYANGIVHSMSQNARQLPASTSDGSVSGFNYAYDQNGNTRMIDDSVRGASYLRYMYYDSLDRLIRATSISFGPNGEHTYSYNALDNLTSARAVGVRDYACYVYDSRNQVVNIKDAVGATVVGLSYDEQGNVQNKNGVLHDFDFGNRLRSVSGKEAYLYDGHGRRLLAANGAGGIWTQYSLSGQQTYLLSDRTGNKEENVYLAGSIVATRVWNAATSYTVKFHHTDALGSPVAVTNQAGTVVERNDYEPYGAVIGKPTYQGIGYTGHVQDAATGLTYMQQRYYDPQVGLFLSVDPVTALTNGDMRHFNRYAYAYNNSYRFTDPDGRCGACDRFGDQFARDAAAGNLRVYEPFEKPAIAVTIAMLPGGPVVRALVGAARTLWSNRPSDQKLPEKVYRAGTEGNPNHVRMREGEDAVSFRDSLSNPANKEQAVLTPGRNYIEVDPSKLPAGSVVADGGKTVGGKVMPEGHVSVRATPEEIVKATVGGGKLPKQ
jgi:RHS repeat-associated protein